MRSLLFALLVLLAPSITNARKHAWHQQLEGGALLAGLPVPAPVEVEYVSVDFQAKRRGEWIAASLVLPADVRWCGVELKRGERVEVFPSWPPATSRQAHGTFLTFQHARRLVVGDVDVEGTTVECERKSWREHALKKVLHGTLRAPLEWRGRVVAAGSLVSWHPSVLGGGVRELVVPEGETWAVEAVRVPAGTRIELDAEGRLRSLRHERRPSRPIVVGELTCRLGQGDLEPVLLHPTGVVETCSLAVARDIAGWPAAADTVRLNRDGTPAYLKTAAPIRLHGATFPPGAELFFTSEGALSSLRPAKGMGDIEIGGRRCSARDALVFGADGSLFSCAPVK